MTDDFRATTTLAALEELGSLTLREHDMTTLLQRVVDLAKRCMPFEAEASILLMANGKPTMPVSTGALATACDEQQFATGEGPCLHASSSGDVTEIHDTRTDPRWRGYMDGAAEIGALSSLSVPLPIAEDMVGALNIYAQKQDAFDAQARSAAESLVPYAAVAVANMQAYQDAKGMADNLQVALQTRAVIDQAKGILMERHKITADAAFQLLSGVSMRRNTKLRTIAEHLVTTGALPDVPKKR